MIDDVDALIAAIASAPGPAERGIVRISGAAIIEPLARLFEPFPTDCRVPTRYAGSVFNPHDRDDFPPIPASLQLWPGVKSYTGQPMAELHLPGSPPLLELVLTWLHGIGVRSARPGEFTLRAFLAGRIDLVQAEAVLGVIDASDSDELTTALRQLGGGVSGRIQQIRDDLTDLLADLEAGLDFVDEDIEFVSAAEVQSRLHAALFQIVDLVDSSDSRMQSTGRQRVVLAGLPNAGKSTLFNRLAGSDAALVSDEAGTTRDYLSACIDCNGLAIELIDTAGWMSQTDADGLLPLSDVAIDRVAQQLRGEQIQQADLVLWCTAADLEPVAWQVDEQLFRVAISESHTPLVRVLTRCDLLSSEELCAGPRAFGCGAPLCGVDQHDGGVGQHDGLTSRSEVPHCGSDIATVALHVSAHIGIGIDELRSAIVASLGVEHRGARQFVGATASRSRDSLLRAREAIASAQSAAGAGDELIALEIRQALDALGEVIGAVCHEDILDRIFSRFCIGK